MVGCTISSEPSNQVPPNPFLGKKPFPNLDPMTCGASSGSGDGGGEGSVGAGPSNGKAGGRVVQVTRFHIRLDDAKTHCFVCAPLPLSSPLPCINPRLWTVHTTPPLPYHISTKPDTRPDQGNVTLNTLSVE